MQSTRTHDLRTGTRLEYFTIAWNVVEASVGMAAGVAAGSVALIGFALDSVVEASSGAILLWRLGSEMSGRRTSEELERRAIRLVALAFFALAAYVAWRATADLIAAAQPDASIPGLVLAAVSLMVMPVLALRKRALAGRLDSRSLQADSRQTWLCAFLSVALLCGLGLNALFGWWWADPVAGILIALGAVREGRELWVTKDICCV